jgi:hypothetical protein
MSRKTVIALLTVASVGLVSPTVASARGGGGGHGGSFGGGGFHGGGFGGAGFHGGGFGGRGFHSGGFVGGGFHGGGFANGFHGGDFHGREFRGRGLAIGAGASTDRMAMTATVTAIRTPTPISYDDNGDCYVVRQRVHTTHGWRLQPVQVCG